MSQLTNRPWAIGSIHPLYENTPPEGQHLVYIKNCQGQIFLRIDADSKAQAEELVPFIIKAVNEAKG